MKAIADSNYVCYHDLWPMYFIRNLCEANVEGMIFARNRGVPSTRMKGEEDKRIAKEKVYILDMKERQSATNSNVWLNSI